MIIDERPKRLRFLIVYRKQCCLYPGSPANRGHCIHGSELLKCIHVNAVDCDGDGNAYSGSEFVFQDDDMELDTDNSLSRTSFVSVKPRTFFSCCSDDEGLPQVVQCIMNNLEYSSLDSDEVLLLGQDANPNCWKCGIVF